MKKLECSPISQFLRFKNIWSSSFGKNYLRHKCIQKSKKRRQFLNFYEILFLVEEEIEIIVNDIYEIRCIQTHQSAVSIFEISKNTEKFEFFFSLEKYNNQNFFQKILEISPMPILKLLHYFSASKDQRTNAAILKNVKY